MTAIDNISSVANNRRPQRVAVVGSGVAGLGTAWLLTRQGHHVTLFERDGRYGGHANTVDVTLDGTTAPVDTGFLVFNAKTYPNLIGLFAELGIESYATDMTFAVSSGGGQREWAGTSLATVFAQPANLLSPAFWSMLTNLLRFNRNAQAHFTACEVTPEKTLGKLLEEHQYSDAFRDLYLVPMAASIWSTTANEVLDYPAATFLRFCLNHGLLQINDRPVWRSVQGGSRSYVERITASLNDHRRSASVLAVTPVADGVSVSTAAGSEHFDAAVLATHAPDSLAMLQRAASAAPGVLAPDDPLLTTLGSFRYQSNRALLHTDVALLPRRRRVWSAWNYIGGDGADTTRGVCVSYLINTLQRLPFTRPVVVTLNPIKDPAPGHLLQEFNYEHPVFDAAAIRAQSDVPRLQGRHRIWLAGAWTRYGFHEDGLLSALRVARDFGDLPQWAAL